MYFNLLVNKCQGWGQGVGVRGQGLVVKSWSSELELESGGLGVRGQYAGVRGQGLGGRSWRDELESGG